MVALLNRGRTLMMDKIRFFSDLDSGETLVFDRADYDAGYSKLPRAYDAERGWVRVTRIVEMKSNPTRHKCDDRCVHATGRTMKCECSCGGKNHGKGH